MANELPEMLEPHAKAILDAIADGRAPASMTASEAISISIAISLKRIADALDSESPRGSVLYYLEQLASAANTRVLA